MEKLKLKSECTKIFDYQSVDISQFAIELQLDEYQLERDLLNFRQRFAIKKEEQIVEKRDILTLSCTSDLKKFQKDHLTIRVGIGLFAKALEEQLIGLTCPGEYQFKVNEVEVNVRLEKNIREHLPELSDEFARNCGVEDIQTLEDIYDYCKGLQYNKQLEDPADEALSYLAGMIVNNSEYILDEEEKEFSKKMMLKHLSTSFSVGDKNFSTFTEEEFEEQFGIPKAAILENMIQTSEYTLKSATLAQKVKEEKGTLLSYKDYEKFLLKYVYNAEEVTDEIRKEHTITEFLLDEYCNVFLETTEKYVLKKLRENA